MIENLQTGVVRRLLGHSTSSTMTTINRSCQQTLHHSTKVFISSNTGSLHHYKQQLVAASGTCW